MGVVLFPKHSSPHLAHSPIFGAPAQYPSLLDLSGAVGHMPVPVCETETSEGDEGHANGKKSHVTVLLEVGRVDGSLPGSSCVLLSAGSINLGGGEGGYG